jgi:alpha-amylase
MNSQHKNTKKYLNLYFQVHQPRRLGQFSFFDIGTGRDYFDDGTNQFIMRRVAKDCYLPTNLLLLKLIRKHPNIRITFSISGTALKQMEVFAPAALESFQMLAATGAVEFLSETYYHSLSFLFSEDEFKAQIKKHADKVKHLFEISPTVFRNTELIYNDEIGNAIHALGFTGVITDGIEKILGERSPNHHYQHPDQATRIFLRNYRLSDDLAFRFMDKDWAEWPLTAVKYLTWLEGLSGNEEMITLGMDYETFGEHQKKDTGIFQFLETLLTRLAKHKRIKMINPTQAIAILHPVGTVQVPESISWADENRDISAWLGNNMQQDAFESLKKLERSIKNIDNPFLLNTWRHLQTSDHFYYMSTKTGNDGGVHNYFSPYASPYAAFMNYMNVLTDFSLQVEKMEKEQCETKPTFSFPHTDKPEYINKNWRPEALTF